MAEKGCLRAAATYNFEPAERKHRSGPAFVARKSTLPSSAITWLGQREEAAQGA